MAEKQNKIIVVDGRKGKTIARLWWDGKKVQTDNDDFLDSLKHKNLPYKISDGPKFLNSILSHYKNGYLHAYRIGEAVDNE